MTIILLILGLIGLLLGSQLTVRGALAIAERYKISQAFFGLTILSLGTDLPELFVGATAALEKLGGTDTSDLLVGEILGSSAGQIGLVLGIAGMFGLIRVDRRDILRDGLTAVGSVALIFLLGFDGLISRLDAVILIGLYGFYFFMLVREERVVNKVQRAERKYQGWAWLSVIGGLVMLGFASDLTVDSALVLSRQFAIPQTIVGVVILGLGTSLPELATSITAIRKKAGSLAVGNVLGSNIFDLLFALGSASLIATFSVSREILRIDVVFLFLLSVLAVALLRRRDDITRMEGAILALVTLIYLAWRATAFF